ncbi:hypothetical protein HOK51_07905 [Candidatus Woesearchaeota archaeon]|jgi:hypothetical protein|nr:hypothetical protein [Candidatus Woesearchaeota archaeon]MBT6519749.1 hypothetical protein [Candidatus Woesearchaeota archaeon]MBT7368129.1 hypothetical protein [Candidatus Woesearchaeota archaeon]
MNQTNIQTKLALKKLKGIKPKGVKVKLDSSLEKMLSVTEQLLVKKPEGIYLDIIGYANLKFANKIYNDLKESLKEVDFSKTDLENWVLVNVDSPENLMYRQGLGVCSGALLTILTERNKQKNKKTIIDIDGSNSQFDGLFCFTKYADEVTLRNFKGNAICKNFIHSKGEGDKLYLYNVGKSSSASSCGENGKLDSVYLINSHGGQVISNHHVKNMWLINNDFSSSEGLLIGGQVERIWLLNNYASSFDLQFQRMDAELLFATLSDSSVIKKVRSASLSTLPIKFENVVIHSKESNYVELDKLSVKTIQVGNLATTQFKPIIDLSYSLEGKTFEEIKSTIVKIEQLYDEINSK